MSRNVGMVVLMLFLGLVIGLGGSGKSEGLPELHLQKIVLDPPSPVSRGETVAIRTWVMNTGGRPAGEFKVEFFYRSRGGESWTSFHVILAPNLSPSKQEALEVKDDGRAVSFDTSDLELGTYELRVVADSNDQIPEEDETNNDLVTSLTVLPSKRGLPDLQPVALAFNPPSPTSDQLVVVSTEIRNSGDEDAGPFRIAFLADGQEFDSTSLAGVAAGADISAQGALDPYALGLLPGSHKLLVIVDSEAKIEEQDEANNELATSLTIQGAELHPESLEFDKPLLRLDGRAIVSSKVVNTGKGAAKTVEVGFYIDGIRFALDQLGSLEKGERVIAQGELIPTRPELGLAPGTHEISVVIDPNNLIPELDEANNHIVKSLTILSPEPKLAELHPESLLVNPPSPIELGRAEVVTVSSVVKNTGRSPAEGFDVELGYRVKGTLRWNSIPCRDPVSCMELALSPGQELKIEGKLALTTATAGVYEIRVVVDGSLGSGSGRIEELDETNNELVTTLTLLSPRLPDLTFDPMTPLVVAPSYQVARGQTLRFAANLVNIGDRDAGPFEVEFGYCRSPEAVSEGAAEQPCSQSSDFTTFSLTPLQGLGVNNGAQSQAILETTALPPGSYLIRVSIDPADPSRPGGRVTEQSEANNLMDFMVDIQGADLMPINLELRPPSPVIQGELVKATATVVNIGVEPTGKFDVNFYWCRKVGEASCTRSSEFSSFGGVAFPGIAVNNPESATGELDTSALEPGEYLIRVTVDPDDRVEEQNELNNELTATLQVNSDAAHAGGKADLAPVDLAVKPSLILRQGQTAHVLVRIANQGQGPAGPFAVQFFYRYEPKTGGDPEAVLFATKRFSGLEVGETVTLQVNLATANLSYGDYVITAVVDSEDKVRELDETNNQIEQIMSII